MLHCTQMSIASYRKNVARRVAGKYKPVCLPAALEQISPQAYRPQIYREYHEFMNWFSAIPPDKSEKYNPEVEELYERLVRPLGGLAFEDLIFKRANTPLGWMRIVNQLIREECRIVADIRYGKTLYSSHSVGIIPVSGQEDHVQLVSTHVPKPLEGIVPLQRVADRFMSVHPVYRHIPGYPMNDANIIALPPAV